MLAFIQTLLTHPTTTAHVSAFYSYSRLDPTSAPRLSYPPCDAAVPEYQQVHTLSSILQLYSQSTAPDQSSSQNLRINGPRFINPTTRDVPSCQCQCPLSPASKYHTINQMLSSLSFSDFSATLSLSGNLGFLHTSDLLCLSYT